MVIEEHAALDVITKDGSTYAIDESHIIRGSLTTSQSCSSGGGIPAGSCNTGTASVAFHAPSALSYEKLFGAKVKLYVWYGDTSKKQVGVYNVTSTERSYGVYTLSLSDNVYLLDEACYSNDTTTAAQNWLAMQLGEKRVPSVIFNMICNAYSVPHWNAAKNEKAVPESGISALSVKVPSDCCTESVKDFANYLAEYLGAIIMPDENGELHFAYMGSRTCPITIDASNIERDTYQKSPFHVSTSSWRVNHDSGIWTSWSVSGDFPDNAAPLSIVVNNNPFWQSVEDGTPESMVRGRTETMLRYMWVAQGKVAYIDNVPQINPFRCTVHVPYYFRAGDRVKIIDPFTSKEYHSYVTDVTWTFRGGQQISCAGEDTRTLSVSTSRNGAKKMSDYSRYLYRKSKSNTGSVEANTYTKSEIDAKDATVKSAADKAQGTADGAVSVNNTQNTQIASLQKSAHTHSNKGVLDKIEQPYTTAERDKLAGLENYNHPTHTAHAKGFYKFASDGEGHVTDAEAVTKKDITALGIPDKDTNTTYKLSKDGNTIKMTGSDSTTYTVVDSDTVYTHPKFTEYANGLYKIAVNDEGHVTNAKAVTKKDITALGIPGSIPIYNVDVDEEYGHSEGMIIATIVVNQTAHPIGVPIIGENENADYGLMSASDKKKLDGISYNANSYVHPTTSGNKHIPSGGSSGQILRWSADGTAVWGADSNTTYSDATQSTHGLMTAADKKKLDGMDLSKYLHYNSMGNMAKGTWYKFASFTCTQYYNYSTAIFAAGFNYGVMRLFRITAGTVHGKPVASRISLINITGNSIGNVGYIINGNTVNFFLKPETGMYGYVTRIGATAETGDFITQTDLVAATTAEAASIVPFTAAGTDVAFSNHSNETDKISNGTLRSGFYVNAAANSTSGYKWFRMATCKISGAYETVNTTFLITNGMTGQGLLSCGIRNGITGKTVESCTLVFSARNGSGVPPGMFRIVAINSDTGVTYELWGQITARWFGVRYTVLGERNISGGNYNNWKLESHSDADAKTAPTTGNYYVNSTDTSIANTLTDSGWIATTRNASFTATSTVKCRKYGQLVEVRGEVTFSDTCGSPTVCTLPAGYRPATVVQACGITPSGKQYMIKADTSGVISFGSDSGSTFVNGTTYRVDLTYLLG